METRRRSSRRAITVVLAVILSALIVGGCASPRPESRSSTGSNGKDSAPVAPPLSGPSDVTTDEPQQQPRDVVTTGTIVLAVSDVAAAANKFTDLAKESGGRVDRRTESTAQKSDDAIPTAELTLRTPSPSST